MPVQHIKGRNWVNVNAEQLPAQAEVSSGAGGPDPDWGGAAHNTPREGKDTQYLILEHL